MTDQTFISPENIYERTGVHKNIDSKMVTPVILTAQRIYILPLLGTALYERLQDGITNSNLTADETILLQQYIRDCLIYYTVSELADTLTYQFWNKGVLKKTNDQSETVGQSELFDLKYKYKNIAENFSQQLIKYLTQEAGTGNKFSEYLNPGSRVDTIHPKKNAYNTGIYLGNCSKNSDRPDWWHLENTRGCNEC